VVLSSAKLFEQAASAGGSAGSTWNPQLDCIQIGFAISFSVAKKQVNAKPWCFFSTARRAGRADMSAAAH
jgi:hypothetical protein